MRSRPLILVFAAAVLLAVAAFHVTDLWWRRQLAIQTAENRATNQALALSEYIRGAFAAADAALGQLAVHAPRIGGAQAPAEAWMPILQAAHAALGEQGSLSVTDADGTIRHSTLDVIIGQSRRDNFVFQHLRDNPDAGLSIDTPFRNVAGRPGFVLPLGRRIEKPDGTFDGIVTQVITPEKFRPFFKTIRIGAEGVIWVFHPSGVVVFREPSVADPLGDNAADNPVLRAALQSAASGILRAPISLEGPGYISAYRRLDEPQLVVAVSHSESEALAGWRQDRSRAALEMLGLTGIMAGLLVILFRQMKARSQVERALADVQRREAERLRQANDRLEAALLREMQAREDSESVSRLKDEFLMTLSHELRTPLNAILGWAHMLSTGSIPEDQRQRALGTIERNAVAQAHLIEGLLDVSRAISGKLQLNLRTINVVEAVSAAIDTLRPALSAKGIVFESSIATDLPAIQADPDRLQQVVWNLLSNAIKFTPAGGVIAIHVGQVSDGIEIAVRDTGIGIAPSFLPHVFERFRQGDAGLRREHGGLGLGLAIARHLVELHGGTLTVESQGEGTGATFRLVLPVHHQTAAAATRAGVTPA